MNFITVTIGEKDYPALLREIANPPSLLYIRGSLPDQSIPTVAIVGTRKATKDGRELTKETARELCRAGVAVVSGLAMGIDTEAHRGALDVGGKTVAVLGNGIDSIYPAQNENLANEILKGGGAIISEYGPDEPSYKGRFIERNRIISGLCVGVIVVEAPEKSGAISTARFAAEQGRSVFVFPASPHNRNYRGSHELIRDGATLVTDVGQVLEDLGLRKSFKLARPEKEFSSDELMVVSALRDAGKPINIDTIIELTTLEPQVASNIVAMLVIEGIVKEGNAGYEISNS